MIRITTVAALCLTTAIAFAQNSAPEPRVGGHGMERMALLLDLDEGQKVAVQKILDDQRQQMITQRKQAKDAGEQRPTRQQMQASFEAKRAETLEKMRPVLSDIQLKKFEALTEHQGPPMGRGKRPDKTR